MAKKNNIRDSLLNKGFFPEVLPPCFDSQHLAQDVLHALDEGLLGADARHHHNEVRKLKGTVVVAFRRRRCQLETDMPRQTSVLAPFGKRF
jgi:hypothetical protein